jgi:hypothetical protein
LHSKWMVQSLSCPLAISALSGRLTRIPGLCRW